MKTKHELGLEAAAKEADSFLKIEGWCALNTDRWKRILNPAINAYLSATATPDKQVDDLVELVRDAIAANDCRIIDSANAVLEVLRPYLKEQTTNQRNAL